MLKKKIIMLTIIFVSLLAISAVNAADNSTDDIFSVEESIDEIDNVLSTNSVEDIEHNLPVTGENNDVGTLSELYASIQQTSSGGTLNLTKNYQLNSNSFSITIDKPILIDGGGHEIDGKNNDFYFVFQSNNITIKNITFKNCLHNEYMYATLSFEGENSLIEGCNFINIINTYTEVPSQIISFSNKNNEIINCKFINNSASIRSSYELDNIENCSFINNSCKNIMDLYHGFKKISNCDFINNYYRLIYSGIGLNIIDNCSFINNHPSDLHLIYMGSGKIYNSIFYDLSEISDLSRLELYNVTFSNSQIKSIAYAKLTDNESLKLVFFDNNNNPLKNKNVTFIINGENFTYSTQNNGFLRFNSTLNLGNNSIVIINPYTKESIKINLTGKKHNIRCSDLIVNYTDNEYYTIRIVDENEAPVSYADITLRSNGYDFPLVTNSQGFASFKLNIQGWTQEYDVEVHKLVLKRFGEVGINEMDIIYGEDIVSKIVIINPLNAEVSISDSKINLGDSVLLTAVILTDYDVQYGDVGIVKFYDGENFIGESYAYQNVATLNYTPMTAGSHNITAIFYSKYYENSNGSAILSVPKQEIQLSIDNIETVYLSNSIDFSVNILSNSNKVNEGTIKYYINDQLIGASNVSNGVSNYHYSPNGTGLFNLKVVYDETTNYLASNISTTFHVDKMPTVFAVDSIIFDQEEHKIFNVQLNDINGKGIGNQTVKLEFVKYSGESSSFNRITDNNGVASFNIDNLAGGMWYVSGIYNGNEKYNNSKFLDKFIIIRMDTTTDIENISNPIVNHLYKLKANIHDENGKLVKEGILQFYLDGVDIGSIDLSKNQGHQSALDNGVISAVNSIFEYYVGAEDEDSNLYIDYIPTKAGKHTLTVVYEGTTIYKSSNSTTTFTVSDEQRPIDEKDISIQSLSSATNGVAIVKLPSDASGTITLSIAGKDYNFDVVSGVANVKVPELANGNYGYILTYSGDAKYSSFSRTGSFTVNNPTNTPTPTVDKTTLTLKTVKVKKSAKKVTLQATLKKGSSPLKGVTVTFKFNGKKYTAKTNANGIAKATIKSKVLKKLKVGKKVKYQASYGNIIVKKTVKVKK